MNTIEKKPTLPPLADIMRASFGQQPMSVPVEPARPKVMNVTVSSPPSLTVQSSPKKQQKCTCKADGSHIPRPRNAFILFRQQYHQRVLDEGDMIKTNPDVSRELGRRWRDLSPKEKEHWNKLAEEEKKRHAEKYPGYRYVPRRFGKKGSCPHCKAKSRRTTTNAMASSTSPNLPNSSTGLVSPISVSPKSPMTSDEHAVAQSFLSLRNQGQDHIVYPLQQQQHQQHHHHQQQQHYAQYNQQQFHNAPQQYQYQPQHHIPVYHQPVGPARHSHQQPPAQSVGYIAGQSHSPQPLYQQHYTLPPVPFNQPFQTKPPSLKQYSVGRELPVPVPSTSSLASLLN